MTDYRIYEEYFKNLNISSDEAKILINYLSALAEIGINNFVEKEMIV